MKNKIKISILFVVISATTLFASFTDEFQQTWATQFGAKGYIDGYYTRGEYDSPSDTAVDSNGNMIIVGATEGNLTGETTAQAYCGFIAKINSDGQRVWTNQCNIGGYQYGSTKGVGTDKDDNIYITGHSSSGPFVAKINPNGTLIWRKNFDITNATEDIYAFYVDNNGIAYVAGVYRPDDYNQPYGIFLVRVQNDGRNYDIRQYGSFQNGSRPTGIAKDSNDNVYISGYVEGDLDGQINSGSNDIFLTKFDPSGNRSWTKLFGSETAPEHQLKSELARDIYIDNNDIIYIVGDTSGNLGAKSNNGNYDMFVTKFSTNGDVLNTFLIGANNLNNPQYGAADHAYDMTVDATGNIYLFGNTSGQFAGESTNGNDHDQLALVKLSPEGTYLWAKQFGECCPRNDDAGVAIAKDTKGNLYLAARVSQYLSDYYSTSFPDIAALKLTKIGHKDISLFATKQLDSYKSYAAENFNNKVTTVGYSMSGPATDIDVYDFDGNFSSAGQNLTNYSKQLPGPIHALTTDPQGNRYIIGYYNDENQAYDAVDVSKYDSENTLIWTKKFSATSGNALPTAITYYNNNLYICGYTEGNIDNNNDNNGSVYRTDGFVLSLNASDGTKRWVDQFDEGDTTTSVWMRDIGVDSKGYIHTIGVDGMTWGPLIVNTYKEDGTIVKFEQYNNYVSSQSLGLAIDGTTLYITGNMNNKIFLSKIDKSNENKGSLIWTKEYGNSNDYATDITIDNAGDIIVSGYTYGDFNATNQGDADILLALFNNDGMLLAANQAGTSSTDKAYGIFVDNNNKILLTGESNGHGFVNYYNINDYDQNTSDANSQLSLLEGWNLVSANLNLQTLPSTIKILWQYDNGTWKAFSPDSKIQTKIVQENNITTLNSLHVEDGTWILSDTNQTITQYSSSTGQTSTNYDEGWSLNGTNHNISADIVTCTNSTQPQFIWKYKNKQWQFFTQLGYTTNNTQFQTIQKYEGFWVYCK
jgi:hypothetical protein